MRNAWLTCILVAQNDVQSVNNPRDVAQQREQNVQPKMPFEPHFEKHPQWRQQNRKKNFDDI
jgi:hypothetical protein